MAERLGELHASGYTNDALRSSLQTLSTMRGHWLDAVWRSPSGGPYVGPGEMVLLQRYRKLKSSPPVARLKAAVPTWLKQRARDYLTKRLQ